MKPSIIWWSLGISGRVWGVVRQTTPPTQITTRLAPEAYAALAERAKTERRSIASLSRIILEAAIAKAALADAPIPQPSRAELARQMKEPITDRPPRSARVIRQARPHPKKGKS